jgi:hypothetical protein
VYPGHWPRVTLMPDQTQPKLQPMQCPSACQVRGLPSTTVNHTEETPLRLDMKRRVPVTYSRTSGGLAQLEKAPATCISVGVCSSDYALYTGSLEKSNISQNETKHLQLLCHAFEHV